MITAMASSAAARPLLEAPGFPRDTAGRVLLLTVIGLAADLLVPWSNVYGQRQPMIHIGAPALGLVLLFALAALPLVRPSFRREPVVGVLPLVVGPFCAGIGAMYWVLLYRENEQASAIPTSVPPDSTVLVSSTNSVVIAPDIGLFLFLIGSAVLAVVGYHLFLAAAAGRASSAVAGIGTAVHPGAIATPGRVSAAAPVLAVASATGGNGQGVGAGQGLAELNGHTGHGGENGHVPGAAGPFGAASVTSVTDLPGREVAPLGELGAPGTAGTAGDAGTGTRVVLPGSVAWNEAPQQLDVKRHVGGSGWPRTHGRLR